MNDPVTTASDSRLDLVFERTVAASPSAIWAAWTQPELLLQWFTPRPWTTVACEIDLRPGGLFATTMRSPEGLDFPNVGCYLEVVENERLAWTNALGPDYRPRALASDDSCDAFAFTAVLSLQAQDAGTRYRARVLHASEAGRLRHEGMGFEAGWAAALEQLLELIGRRAENRDGL